MATYQDDPRWQPEGSPCPICKNKTEMIVEEVDGELFDLAERCTTCRWVWDFMDGDGPEKY